MESADPLGAQRREKLSQIRAMGVEPYPYRFEPTHSTIEIQEQFEALKTSGDRVAVAGRLMAIRKHGKTSFAHLQDRQGRVQIYVRKDRVGEEAFGLFKMLDIGDHVGVEGRVFRTKSGEITVEAKGLVLLAKSLRSLPIAKQKTEGDKRIVYDEFTDKEARYRQRYVDLVVNPEVRRTFETRAKILSAIRAFLDQRGFLEVDTPTLQPLYGGASARPFVTHHNALDMPLYLRISNELYLKRLIIGGLEKVYEFSKDFRNEGMDRLHNPEFTLLELYEAYADYGDMMALTEQMFATVAQEVVGTVTVRYQGQEIDLSPPWTRLTMFEAIEKHAGADVSQAGVNELRTLCEQHGIETDIPQSRAKLIAELFEACAQPNLIQPTFVTDYPRELSPLAKQHRENPELCERFEPFVCGLEVGNAFSELNDPADQRQRFEQQLALQKKGDDEAHPLDEDFLRALEYGMPPTGGLGIGIDRVVMVLTDAASIRDVLFFPLMRPEPGK